MATAKQILAGVGVAAGIGLAVILASGGDSGGDDPETGGREPWTEPLDMPTDEDVVLIKTTICTLDRGGVKPDGLALATLDRVYAGMPWDEILRGPVEGDDPTVQLAASVIAALVQEYFQMPVEERESWCGDPTAPDPIAPPPPPVPPKGAGSVPSNVIGGGWETWPEKGKWPSESTIAQSLALLGYGVTAGWFVPGYKITTDANRKVIKKFQSNWNFFRSKPVCTTMIPNDATGHIGSLLASSPKTLTVDGWIGPNTWKALRVAFYSNAIKSGSWQSILASCKGV